MPLARRGHTTDLSAGALAGPGPLAGSDPDGPSDVAHSLAPSYPKRRRLRAWLQGGGIEIGALNRPMELPESATVRYVDRMTVPELRSAYPELAGFQLAPVDMIGDIESMPDVLDGSQDFVVANHLLEHLHDPIRGLQEMYRVLRDGGILFMALPDPRVTFDRDRAVTPVSHILDEHRDGPEAGLRAHYEEWVDVVEKVTEGRDLRIDELMARRHSIHFHVWRPDGFLEFLTAAKGVEHLDLELVAFGACEHGVDDEFIVVLRKGTLVPPPPQPEDRSPSPSPGSEASESGSTPAQAAAPPLQSSLRQRVARSPAGPLLRPLYRRLQTLARAVRSR